MGQKETVGAVVCFQIFVHAVLWESRRRHAERHVDPANSGSELHYAAQVLPESLAAPTYFQKEIFGQHDQSAVGLGLGGPSRNAAVHQNGNSAEYITGLQGGTDKFFPFVVEIEFQQAFLNDIHSVDT